MRISRLHLLDKHPDGDANQGFGISCLFAGGPPIMVFRPLAARNAMAYFVANSCECHWHVALCNNLHKWLGAPGKNLLLGNACKRMHLALAKGYIWPTINSQ